MKTKAILLPCIIGLSACSHAPSPIRLPHSSAEHNAKQHAIPRAEPARIYRFTNGSFAVNSGYGIELNGLNYVTILGAVKYPGVYYFKGNALLEDIIDSAQPFPGDEGSAHTCGSANLTKIQIFSASQNNIKIPEPLVVNFLKYTAPSPEDTLRNRINLSSGIIHIPEWF